MEYVTDECLEVLSIANGPRSAESTALALLRDQRSRDRQVFAFRIGDYYMIGPMPDAETELMVLMAHELARRA